MEALKILRKHMEGHYLFGNEVSSEQLVDFQKSLVSAMEEYAELRLSNVVGQSEQLFCPEHEPKVRYDWQKGNCLTCAKKLEAK